MSQATLGSGPYRNSSLFSGYYLDERVADLDDWESDDEAEAAFEALRELWELEGEYVASHGEDELIDQWIGEVLDILGFDTISEGTLPGGGGYVDRLLYESREARYTAADRKQNDDREGMFSGASALLEAKQWGHDFEARFSDERPYRDASHQVKYYLERTPSDLKWGILTDGRKWRLYGTKDYETQTYYEVDLPELLESGDLQQFKYFYCFFRPEAFTEVAGTSFLETVWSESETAAQELGEDLQDNVFTALRVLGKGFVESNDLAIDSEDESARAELKEQSLVLLYRLMFVLYAESRGLIDPEEPSANAEYHENFSLEEVRSDIIERVEGGDIESGAAFREEYSEFSTTIWNRLSRLFELIDDGEEALDIPPYNGGLFDHDDHEFLAENAVSDAAIAEVIFRLSTTKNDEGEHVPADYADLDTRHLGSIYEGLLEHEFRIAPEAGMAAVAAEGGQVWKPADEVSVADAVETVDGGGLYVVNDEGERKATGAYYTPDYVVTYIVEETIDPLIDEIHADLEADGLSRSDTEYFRRFYDRVTDLTVLDPAMGSGHFLTKATGYLTEQVMSVVREQEIQSYDEQEFRRDISKEVIYGVDINGMAVELAKLSMWLETLAADQPLAFLDHHLKAGNSLVGSDITEVLADDNGDDGGQLTLTQAFARVRQDTLEHVMELMADLLAYDNETLADVKSMEELYDEIRDDPLYTRLFELANVHTAEEFGVDVPEDAYEQMASAIEDGDDWEAIRGEDWFISAQATADEQDFFHWELEFPEVFFDSEGEKMSEAGFDAVVGNPPYVNISEVPEKQKEYLSVSFTETYAGNSDLLYYFIQQGVGVLRHQGVLGLIVSRYFTQAHYAKKLREYLLDHTRVNKIVDFGNYQAFPGVDILANIVFCVRDDQPGEYDVSVLKLDNDDVTEDTVSASLSSEDPNIYSIVDLDASSLSGHPWNLINESTLEIKQKMDSRGWPLRTHYDVVQSMQTGFNEGLVVGKETIEEYDLEDDLLKRLAKTKNVRRYLIKDLGEYVLWTQVADIDEYPNTKSYLEQYRSNLADRYDIKQRNANWWEISNPRNADLFNRDEPRILTPYMSTSNKFAIDTEQRFNDGGDIRALFEQESSEVSVRYVLSILNSKLGEFYHKNTAKLKRDGYYEYYGNALENFPVYDLSPTEKEPPEVSEVWKKYRKHADDDGSDLKWLTEYKSELGDNPTVVHEVLTTSSERMREYHEKRFELNLDLFDYLGNYTAGEGLSDTGLYQPASTNVLDDTVKERNNLRIGTARVDRESPNTVLISATARYKPDDEEAHETDQWGYTETEYLPAFRITDLSEREADLIEHFVPVAVDEAGGFANFRETATKTNSLIDRLKALELPDVDDVGDDLENYLKTKERAEELDAKIERTDQLIDEIVYELYGLTDEEIEMIEEAVGE